MKPAVCYEPCAKCPFRTDREPFLTKARAREIMTAMVHGNHFDCHQTLDYSGGDADEDGSPRRTNRTAICAGFAIIAERAGKPTQMMRIAERLGAYDHAKLNMDAPVHKTATAFIKAQPR
jgi:hypothetical protein